MIDEVVLQAVYVSPSLVDRSIDLKVSAGELLEIEPPQLEFPFELEKQISCSIQLSNKTDDHVAFRGVQLGGLHRSAQQLDPLTSINVQSCGLGSPTGWITSFGPAARSSYLDQCAKLWLQCKRKAKHLLTCNAKIAFLLRVSLSSKEPLERILHMKCFLKRRVIRWIRSRCQLYMSLPNPSSPFPGGCDEGFSCGNASWEFGNGLRRRRMLQSDRTMNPDDNFAGHIETSTPKAYQVQKFTGRRHW
ncbi:uncharacterized protein A4U43_C09F3400 [Asparagus officinalis]|uniref:MSP domain-containing protein n=1 Tax=Asparagus officinalis TaxID=4686 RepID=A0A5P1E515_ASPOF|nr:uncharacterized protein A4U43_C09F3400 [Asparagus officinalis]